MHYQTKKCLKKGIKIYMNTNRNFSDGNEPKLPTKKENKNFHFNEEALCRAYMKKFYSMGILTSAETGLIINAIDRGSRPTA